jgi:3-isopropylmalate/(R)-2-methylmalate dehydratase small subunit
MRPLQHLPASSAAALHRVWKFGADIDTDALAPGHAMKYGVEQIAAHCLASLRPEFALQVQAGDVIVAGSNFGIGSSREQAAAVLVQLGLAAVIAPSFGGLYFRNAFNVGLLLLVCPQAESLLDGDRISFDARAGTVHGAQGESLACEPIPGFLLEMVEAGGLFPMLKRRAALRPPNLREDAA